MISDSPWTSSRTRSGTRTDANVATAATASVGAITAPSMNAAGQVRPSTSAWAATATADIVTSTSASASRPSARLSACSSRGEEYQPAASSSGGTKTSRTTCESMSTSSRPGTNASAEPAEHEHDRVRDADAVGHPHEQDGAEQQREEELEVAHGRVSLGFARPSGARSSPPCLTVTEDHVAGPYDAPLELVMYGDFQCPYCSAAQSIVRRVRDRLDGRLRFVFRHLPLTEVHPDAQRAAEAAEAAAAQGSFWEMHDALYANGGRLARADLVAVADRIGLDVERFRADLAGRRVRRPRRPRRRCGARERRHGTPAFFVNGERHTESFDARSLVEALTSDPATRRLT